LPAFEAKKIVPSPFQKGGPQALASSPVSGRSTLTTSAPSAARICAQYGPAIDVVTSSTRMPSSGCCFTGPIIAAPPSATMEEVFHSLVNAVSGAWWSYPLIFAVAMLDAFFPLVPSETVAITSGVLAGSGDLSLPLCILCAAAGAFVGDNIS